MSCQVARVKDQRQLERGNKTILYINSTKSSKYVAYGAELNACDEWQSETAVRSQFPQVKHGQRLKQLTSSETLIGH